VSRLVPVLPLRISHFKVFLQLPESVSVTFIKMHINESCDVEGLEKRKVNWGDVSY